MQAITAAANYLGAKYLNECSLFVTLEPCNMCAGAIYWAQLQKLVIGAPDTKRGFTKIGTNLLHPKTNLIDGVLKEDCANLLKDFFKNLRG
jgi:tRNA(adenine34) deaminase